MRRRPSFALLTALEGPNSTAGLDLAGTCSVAELVTKQMYEQFLEKFPPVNSRIVDVQKWILMWFALDDSFMNDIAVPKYVAHLIISGSRLRTLSDVAICQYLAIQNVRLCVGTGGKLYPKYVIEKLAADIGEARRRAIPLWTDTAACNGKGKPNRLVELNSERNKRRKLMYASVGHDNGDKTTDAEALDGGDRHQNETDVQNIELPLSTEVVASATMKAGTDTADDKLATYLTALGVSEVFEFGLSSPMATRSSSSNGKGDEKVTENESAVETLGDEDDEDLLMQRMESFKRIGSTLNPLETGEPSVQDPSQH